MGPSIGIDGEATSHSIARQDQQASMGPSIGIDGEPVRW